MKSQTLNQFSALHATLEQFVQERGLSPSNIILENENSILSLHYNPIGELQGVSFELDFDYAIPEGNFELEASTTIIDIHSQPQLSDLPVQRSLGTKSPFPLYHQELMTDDEATVSALGRYDFDGKLRDVLAYVVHNEHSGSKGIFTAHAQVLDPSANSKRTSRYAVHNGYWNNETQGQKTPLTYLHESQLTAQVRFPTKDKHVVAEFHTNEFLYEIELALHIEPIHEKLERYLDKF